MAVTIDERVVEMRFNNKQFENNVNQSINSLNRLDQSVNNLEKTAGLDDFQKKIAKVDFTGMERSLGSLEKRFSVFGIAGKKVIEDLTGGLERGFLKFVSWLNKPIAQIKSGGWRRALNIEDAKFQLNGLKVAWDDIKDDIDYAVSGTAFGLDAAAKAASQLVASGVELGDSMKGALRGISGVAAMANTSYEEISPIFTTVAGQGRLMTMQLRQLEARGLNAAAEIGKYLGKTEQQVREMVTKGKIDFDTFATAMDSAFGQHAKDANKTFTGSLNNMNAALSRIGADIATPYMDNMIKLHNDLRVAIDNLHVALKPAIEELNKWLEIWILAQRALLKWVTTSESIQKTFDKFMYTLKIIGRAVADLIPQLMFDFRLMGNTIHDIGESLGDILTILFGVKTNLTPLQIVLYGMTKTIKLLLVLVNGLLTAIKNILVYLATSGILDTVMAKLIPLSKVILPAIVAWLILTKIHLNKVAIAIGLVVAGIVALMKLGIVEKIVDIGQRVIGIIKTFVSTIYNGVAPVFKFIIWLVKGLASALYNTLTGNEKAAKEILKNMGNVGFIADKFGTLAGNIGKAIAGLGSIISKFFATANPVVVWVLGLGTVLVFALRRISTAIARVSRTINTFSFKNIEKLVNNLNPLGFLNTLSTGVKDFLKNMSMVEATKAKAVFIATLAASLLAFAIACGVLAKYVDPDSFVHIAAGISLITAALALLAFALAKAVPKKLLDNTSKTLKDSFGDLAESVKIKALSGFLRTVIVLIAALVIAMLKLHKAIPNPADLAIIAGSLTLMSSVLIGLMLLVAKVGKAAGTAGKMIALGLAFSSMALGILILSKAIAAFPMLKKDIDVIGSLLIILSSMGTVLGVAWLASKVLGKASLGFLNLAISAIALSVVLTKLPDIIQSLGTALARIGVAFKEIAVTADKDLVGTMLLKLSIGMTAIIAASKLAKNAIRAGILMIAAVTSIGLFIEYLRRISSDKQALQNIADAFWQLSGVLAAMVIVMSAMMFVSKFAEHGLRAAAVLIALPLSLIGFVGVMFVLNKVISGLDNDQLIKLGACFGALSVVLGALLVISGKFKGSIVALLGLTAVILAITGSITALSYLASKDPVAVTIAAIYIMGIIGAIGIVLRDLGEDLKKAKMFKTVVMILAMTAAIGSIARAMKTILVASDSDWVAMSMSALLLAGLLTVLGIVAIEMLKATEKFGKVKFTALLKVVIMINTVVKAMTKMSSALAALAAFSWKKLISAVLSMISMMLALGVMVVAMTKIKAGKLGSVVKVAILIGAITGAMRDISKAVARMADYNWKKLMGAVVAMGLLMAELSLTVQTLANIKARSFGDVLKISALMVAIATVMLVVSVALTGVAQMDMTNVIAAAASIAMLFGALALAVVALNNMPTNNPLALLSMIAAIGAMSFAIIPMALALGMLAQFDWKSILAAAGAMSLVFTVFAVTIGIMANMPMINPLALIALAGAMIVLSTAMIPLAMAIGYLANQNVDGLIEAAGALAIVSAVLGGIMIILALIPGAALAVIPIAAALTLALLGLGAAAVLIGAGINLAEIALERFGEFLVRNKDTINEALTEFGKGLKHFIVDVAKGISKAIRKQGKAIGKSIITVLYSIGAGISSMLNAMAIGYLSTIDKSLEMLITIVHDRGIQLVQTIYDLILSIANAISMGLEALWDVIVNGGDIGDWIGKSVAGGIEGSFSVVEGAAERLGAKIEESLRNRVQVHSFSPLFGKIGEWIGVSVSGGMDDSSKDVEKSGENLGEAAQEGVEKKNIGQSLFDGIKGFVDKHKDKFSGLGDTCSKLFGDSFVDGIKGIFGGAGDSAFFGVTEAFDEEAAKIKAENELLNEYSKGTGFKQAVEFERQHSATLKGVKDTVVWNDALTESVERQRAAFDKANDTTGGLADMLKQFLGDEEEAEDQTEDTGDSVDDFTNSMDDADKKTKQTTKTIKGATEVFGEFNRTVTLTSKEMLTNVKDNLVAVSEWELGLQRLMKRGLDPRIISDFIDAGMEGSYQQVAVLNSMNDKQFAKANKRAVKARKAELKAQKDLLKGISKDGKKYNKEYLKSIKYDKNFDMGLKDWSTYTGKKLNKAFRKAFNKLDFSVIMNKSKGMSKALESYVDASTSKSKEATEAFEKFIRKAYMESLDESQRQEWLGKKAEDQTKDVTKWWKEQEKAIREAVYSEVRSMDKLSEKYTQTGEDYKKELKQQKKDYKQALTNRRTLAMMFRSYGYEGVAKTIETELEDEQILSMWQDFSVKGGEASAEAWVKGWRDVLVVNKKGLANDIYDYEALKKDSKEAQKAFVNANISNVTQFKETSDIMREVVDGVENKFKTLFGKDASKADRTLKKIAKNISGAFTFLDADTGMKGAISALQQYALTLIDVEELEAQAKETGVDVSELIQENLNNVTSSLKDFRNNIESSLKSALQSFEKFDEGEKKSFEDMAKNLESNVTKLNEWRAMMKKMQQMGYSKDIIEYMASQGVNSYAEVAALTAAGITSAQIDHVNQMWEQVDKQSEIGADEAFGAVAIAAGTAGRDTVDGVIAEVEDEIRQQNAEVSKSINDAGSEATNTIKNQEEPVTNAVTAIVKSGSNAIRSTIKYLQGDGVLPTLIKDTVLKALPDDLKLDVYRRMTNVGTMVQLGLVDGITSEEAATKTINAGKKLANGAILGAKSELDVNSPSGVFEWIGNMAVDGLALGFSKNAYRATDEMDELSNSLVAYAQRLSDDLANAVPTEDEWTIKPVLNLDELQNAHSLINSMLGNGDIAVRSSTLASQTATQSEWSMLSKALSGVSGETTNNTYGDTQIIVNPPQGSNSREIAQMVMGEIQRQMDRRQRI